jgi:predicted transcriptional regulator
MSATQIGKLMGGLVAKHRRARGMTQIDLAGAARVHPSTVARLDAGAEQARAEAPRPIRRVVD